MSISQGAFYGVLVGFTTYSFIIGFFFINSEVENPYEDKITTVAEIFTCYQALMIVIFTFI